MDITKACRDMKELNPLAQQACKIFLEECKKQGVNIFITETYRSQARQDYIYGQGRTRSGIIVTHAKKSNHTGRMAWDIACSPPQSLYDIKVLSKAGEIARNLGITWGGDWKGFVDRPHFEINSNWKIPIVKYSIIKIKVNICGVEKFIGAINIKGNNYCKLRDISCEKIVIDFKNNTIYINGKPFSNPESVLVDGNNFVKLQSVNGIGGIKVTYDSIGKIPVISV